VTKGGYSNYLALRQSQATVSTNGKVEPPKGKRIREQSKAEKRAIEKKAREIAEIEAVIEATEQKLAQLSAQLEEASLTQNISGLQTLSQKYQAAEAKLEELITQWTEMEAA
jgi:uncharacterized protein involved in exopolysaccharide biosynthesis